MKLKQVKIWDRKISYVCDTKVTKIIWTDRNWRLKEIDMPQKVY